MVIYVPQVCLLSFFPLLFLIAFTCFWIKPSLG
jgi:hypothetical protein